ncbi:MAG TPA: hypothetical protein VE974_11305 [Thermoanaerobaculia bacterium]|nr:hypothetical protein [Thermoanaerobaculia bacterium]
MQLRSTTATLLGGGILVGSIDALYAISFWAPRGATPTRIFQSIAAGLLGRSAFEGGVATALLGVALHYFIALTIVVVYWFLSRRFGVLLRRYLLCGAAYGLGVYAVMNYVVIPLSANPRSRFNLSWVIWSVIVHALLIGIPAALTARLARGIEHHPRPSTAV